MDFILNGQAHGSVASMLLKANMDPRVLRPYSIDGRGTYITVTNSQGKEEPRLISNAPATMTKDAWILLDRAIVEAAKPRLRAVSELRSRGLQFNIPNGMSKTVLQTQTQSDISEADISMNGVRQSQNDRPEFELGSLPLPIIHKDFSIYLRELAVSQNGGAPLDTTTAGLASRRVAELAEKLLIGTYGTYKFGGGTIYGLVNFPSRLTQALTDPTATAWTPEDTVAEVLSMKQKSQDAYHYGPWILFNSAAWDEYLDADYSVSGGNNPNQTLRERILKIKDIVDCVTLDYLTDFQLVLVQLTPDVVREVIGMEITTLQWESNGGLELNFKVMAIMVPQLRADINGNTGVVHGSVS